MKSTLIASALIALSLSTSAFAQRGDHGYDRDGRNAYSQNGRYDNDRRDNDRRENGRYDGGRYDNDRHDGPRGYRDNSRYDARYDDARRFYRDDRRGGGPRHDLRRGQRLDQQYRHQRYVVTDWRVRHLSAPPRGHHWVRAGNDYVLAAIATGLIAQVLLSN